MAKVVKVPKNREFVFKASRQGGFGSVYPWDEWLNGDLLLLEQSKGEKDDKGNVTTVTEKGDYDVATDFMPAKLKLAARRRYKIVQVSRYDLEGKKLDNSLIIRARDMDEQEREAENEQRIKDKEKALERKAKAGSNGIHEDSEEAE